jgi:hypothetical protein
VFAQVKDGISVGGWARGVFVPIAAQTPHDGDAFVTAGVTNNYSAMPEVKFQIDGTAGEGFAGFRTETTFVNTGAQNNVASSVSVPYIQAGDFAELWVKPASWLRVDLGKYVYDELRGKYNNTDYHQYVLTFYKTADDIFRRFQNDRNGDGYLGALIRLTPIDGLTIGANFNAPNPGKVDGKGGTVGKYALYANKDRNNYGGTEPNKAGKDGDGQFQQDTTSWEARNLYENIQLAVGYNIPNIGLARVQYLGAASSVVVSADQGSTLTNISTVAVSTLLGYTRVPTVQAAFALTAVQDLTVDLGLTLPFKATFDKDGYIGYDAELQKPITIALAARYKLDDFAVDGRVDTTLGGSVKFGDADASTEGLILQVNLVPSYNLGFVVVGGELGFRIKGTDSNAGTEIDESDGIKFGAGLWLQKNVANGYLKGGFGYTAGAHYGAKDKYDDAFFTIPIVAGISF